MHCIFKNFLILVFWMNLYNKNLVLFCFDFIDNFYLILFKIIFNIL